MHIITFALLRKFFVLFFMITVQVNGAELVFTVIAEEVCIPAFSTKSTSNFSDIPLHFECLFDPNVFLYYAHICYNTNHLKKNSIFAL